MEQSGSGSDCSDRLGDTTAGVRSRMTSFSCKDPSSGVVVVLLVLLPTIVLLSRVETETLRLRVRLIFFAIFKLSHTRSPSTCLLLSGGSIGLSLMLDDGVVFVVVKV